MAFVKYVAVGCNQTAHSADWNTNDVLAYCAGDSVAIAVTDKVGKLEVEPQPLGMDHSKGKENVQGVH